MTDNMDFPIDADAATKVVVVDSDDKARLDIRKQLLNAGYAVVAFSSPEAASACLAAVDPEAVLLALGNDSAPGLSLIQALRSSAYRGHVLCLSGMSSVRDRIRALDTGADDVLDRPFLFDELRARLRAALRRRRPAPAHRLIHDGLVLDLRRHVAILDGVDLGLSQRELHLLTLFVEQPGQILDRGYLLAEVWSDTADRHRNLLDVTIRRLREKLAGAGDPPHLRTVRGKGYRLD